MSMFRVMFPYNCFTAIPDNIEELAEARAFDGLTGSAADGAGWGSIVGETRVIQADGRTLLKYREASRKANAVAVRQLVEERVLAAVEAGREVTEQLQVELTAQAESEVIRFAPIKEWSAYILVCPAENLLLVSGSSAPKCEDALSMLRYTLESLSATPWGFGGDIEANTLTNHLASQIKPNPYPLPASLTISPFGKTSAVGSDTSLKLIFDGVSTDQPESKILLKGMTVRQVEMSLVERPDDGQFKNLANFILHLPRGGNLHFKSYDYENDAEAGDEDEEDAQHTYAVEMLLVSQYTEQILKNLAEFFGVAFGDDQKEL